jgi:hypothetical protein
MATRARRFAAAHESESGTFLPFVALQHHGGYRLSALVTDWAMETWYIFPLHE